MKFQALVEPAEPMRGLEVSQEVGDAMKPETRIRRIEKAVASCIAPPCHIGLSSFVRCYEE